MFMCKKNCLGCHFLCICGIDNNGVRAKARSLSTQEREEDCFRNNFNYAHLHVAFPYIDGICNLFCHKKIWDEEVNTNTIREEYYSDTTSSTPNKKN